MIYPRGGVWTFDAPAGAVSLAVGGDSGTTATTQVADGEAVFAAAATAALLAGEYAAEWTFPDGRIAEGPRFTVAASIAADGEAATWKRLTHAERMVASLRKLLETAAESADLSLSTADGQQITFEDRAALAAELHRWEYEVAVDRGEAPLATVLQ